MSTKNLARTVIEGGRTHRNQFDRRESSRVERHQTRSHLHASLHDPELLEEETEPTREPVRKSFHDKLSPAERWLDRRVGRSWNKTYARMRETFDDRTTAGRHILFDHLLRDVRHHGDVSRGNQEYAVDRRGVLRLVDRRRPRPSWFDFRPLVSFLDGRMVGARGAGYFWFVAVRASKVEIDCALRGYGHERRPEIVYRALDALPRLSFRQAHRLNDVEHAFVEALPEMIRGALLSCAP